MTEHNGIKESWLDVIECPGGGVVPDDSLVLLAITEHGSERSQLRGKMWLKTMVRSDQADEFTEFLGTGGLGEARIAHL